MTVPTQAVFCSCLWMCKKVFCMMYPNQTCVFDTPTGLWKVVMRFPIGCLRFSTSIDWYLVKKIITIILFSLLHILFCRFQLVPSVKAFSLTVRVIPRGNKAHWIYLLQFFGDSIRVFPSVPEVFNHPTSLHWGILEISS